MKKTILFFNLFALWASAVASQTIQFAYDEAGNRISRVIVFNTSGNTLRSGGAETDATSLFEEQLATDLQVKIYPNPTKGRLQVELSGMETDETAQFALFGLNGEKLLQMETISPLTPIDMSTYPTGIYVLTLTIRGQSTDYKIVKQ
jgi:hypothetical protein